MKKCLHSFAFIIAKLDLDNGQLFANNGNSATGGSKGMTRIVNELKMRSKTDNVDSVVF